MSQTAVPGVRAFWRWITDACRAGKGDDGAVREVVEGVERELHTLLGYNDAGRGVRVHVVVTVEHPPKVEE